MNLYTPIKAGYKSPSYQRKELAKMGYIRDDNLSNHNQQTYYSPAEKKLLFNVAGTHNLSDVGTDVALAFGMLNTTNRFKEAQTTLKKAKDFYGVKNANITGHSLGGSIASFVDDKDDSVCTLDKGTAPFQKTDKNEKDYRTEGDLVSLFSTNAKHTTTLKNPNKNNILPNLPTAHDVDNIKNQGIRIV